MRQEDNRGWVSVTVPCFRVCDDADWDNDEVEPITPQELKKLLAELQELRLYKAAAEGAKQQKDGREAHTTVIYSRYTTSSDDESSDDESSEVTISPEELIKLFDELKDLRLFKAYN